MIDVNFLNGSTKFLEKVLVASTMISENTEPERRSGFICAYDLRNESLVSFPIGQISGHKIAKYCRCATEKVTRLLSNGHLRSFQTANPQLEHYGGGLRYLESIVAFSGLLAEIDEAVALAYAIYLHEKELDIYFEISAEFTGEITHKMRMFYLKMEEKNEFINLLAEQMDKINLANPRA